MPNDLKPCPFCGGKPFIRKCQDVLNRKYYSVKCTCGVLIHFSKKRYEVIDAWNRRADVPEIVEIVQKVPPKSFEEVEHAQAD